VIAAAVAMANVAVLSMQMFVSDHDATLVTVLLVYAVGTGLAAALAVSRVSSRALAGVRATADRLADGDLDARAGRLDAGPEIDALGRALDQMASRRQLVTLVDDLFELSQLDAGAIATETRRARLVDVVASAVDAVGAEATRKHLSLATDLGGAEDTPCSPRLTRVLQNLLSNAVRHTP